MSDRITAMDIESQEFPKNMRGYCASEVRLYLRAVAEEVQRLNRENADLREESARRDTELDNLRARENTLQETLIAAQRMADEMKEKSRAEADLVIREARAKSERLLQQSQDQLARIEDEIGRAQLERDTFEKEVRSLAEQHLELLELRQRRREAPDQVPYLRSVAGSEAG